MIVSTSNHKSDDPIAKICIDNDINLFRGSLENVASRFLESAKFYNLDYAIRINGDNIFADYQIINKMIDIVKSGKYLFYTNVPGRTFPPGISVEIIKIEQLDKSIKLFNKLQCEHVMPFFYENLKSNQIYIFENDHFSYPKDLNLAIDTTEDFLKIQAVIKKMTKPHWEYNTFEVIQLFNNLNR